MHAREISCFDPFSPEAREDPYPFYAWLRREAPVYYNEERDFWVLSRHGDVQWAARMAHLFSSAEGVGLARAPANQMISFDPPIHTRLRSLVAKAFTPRVIEGLEDRIQGIVEDLLDEVIAKGCFELVADLAFPLPVIVIAELLGVEPERREDLKRWSDQTVEFISDASPVRERGRIDAMWNQFRAYFSQVIEARRARPREDLVSLLAHAEIDGDRLTDSEILNFCQLLLVAGNETTTNLITNAALALFEFPGERRKLRGHPERVPAMVEEALRYDTPVQLFFRSLTEEVVLHDVTIPEGARVLLLFGAANRDETVFEAPDRFDIARNNTKQLGFGYGVHYCLGAPLARLEARIFAEAADRKFRHIGPDPDKAPSRTAGPIIRGLERFPLVFEAA